jgi:hypothetical protein
VYTGENLSVFAQTEIGVSHIQAVAPDGTVLAECSTSPVWLDACSAMPSSHLSLPAGTKIHCKVDGVLTVSYACVSWSDQGS